MRSIVESGLVAGLCSMDAVIIVMAVGVGVGSFLLNL